ncbi:hypothetical protein SAMN06265222_102154 [Neorhodopirellula lusitana]|uniref:Uncharacterized protein n=1 Tax=Neorhodopirellula lusitana TaxID=445327 RepID=A0ABY1PTK6_9BACT|nr:hypothetical protein SAMN06265222_102154 [Neorhodopirellula lusitana]
MLTSFVGNSLGMTSKCFIIAAIFKFQLPRSARPADTSYPERPRPTNGENSYATSSLVTLRVDSQHRACEHPITCLWNYRVEDFNFLEFNWGSCLVAEATPSGHSHRPILPSNPA